jgi:hypothetical protein
MLVRTPGGLETVVSSEAAAEPALEMTVARTTARPLSF